MTSTEVNLEDIELTVKVSYKDYKRAMKILKQHHETMLRSRERMREKRGTKGDESRCTVQNMPKFTIVEPHIININPI